MSKISPSPRNAGDWAPIGFDDFIVGTDLRRDGVPLEITPKAFALLRALLRRAGQLVTKRELWEEVWPRVIVTDAALTMCVAEVRRVLDDDARCPRYIATVPKRGYRFIAAVTLLDGTTSAARHLTAASPGTAAAKPPLVGRANELRELRAALDDARSAVRRIAFLVG